MGVLGFLGLANAASNDGTGSGAAFVEFLVLLTVGVATVFGLRSSILRFPAAALNGIFAIVGMYLILIVPDGVAPELRRMLGVFCMLGGGTNFVALLTAPRTDPGEIEKESP